MNILKPVKIVAKVAGTAVLGAAGAASGILQAAADSTGKDLGSEVFGSIKEASFNGIRTMWGGAEAVDRAEENIDNVSSGLMDDTKRKMAETAYKAAQAAKKAGDMDRYEEYMDKYYNLKG